MTTLLSGVLTLALLSLEATEKWSETDKQLLKEGNKEKYKLKEIQRLLQANANPNTIHALYCRAVKPHGFLSLGM